MARFGILLFLLQLVLAVVALIGCLSAEEGEIRALPRLVWVLIILLFPFVGPVAWYFAGRPRPTEAAARPGPNPPRRGPVAPDDNPDFLRSLDDDQAARDRNRELFDQWEEDLKRREEQLRRDNDDPKPGPTDA